MSIVFSSCVVSLFSQMLHKKLFPKVLHFYFQKFSFLIFASFVMFQLHLLYISQGPSAFCKCISSVRSKYVKAKYQALFYNLKKKTLWRANREDIFT